MSDRRFPLDFAAFGLLAAGLLVALCVLGHDPAGATVYPRAAAPSHLLGPPGAWLAEALFEALGVAVYLLLASWFVLVVMLFLRKGLLTWSLRLAGWLVLVVGGTVLADYLGPLRIGGPLTGGGGSVGAWLADWLDATFRPAGRAVFLGGVLLAGLGLALDFVLVPVLRYGWRAGRGLPRVGWGAVRWLLIPPARPRMEAVPRAVTMPPRREETEAAPPRTPAPAPRTIPIRHHDQAAVEAARMPPSDAQRFAGYELPPLKLLEDSQPFPHQEHDQHLRQRAALLEKTFTDFGLNVRVVGINTGPVVTQYEIALEKGLRLNRVTSLADDLALNLKVPSVRLVAPLPGKDTVGVEVPNEHRAVVRLKEVLLAASPKLANFKIPLFLGKDTEGRALVYDLAEMPHLLIAGRTGTGKSVCMNSIILSVLMTRRPDEVKMIMIDPKQVELTDYERIPHLMHPIVRGDMKKAEAILAWAVDKMEERYDLLCRARVRSIAAYNELKPDEIRRRLQSADEDEVQVPERLPYIVIVVDEVGDLIMQMKKEVEGHIIRLAQKSRAAGIHLVLATQKPTVDVITGLIKSNLPARICFQVSSRTDSRVVLDEMGADKLLGKGDMLFLQPGTSTLSRAQGTYVSDKEIEGVAGHLECDPCYDEELLQLKVDRKSNLMESLKSRDELYEQAIEVVVREGRGSVSLLQRTLGIGYGRAARLIDFMAEDGLVGAYNGSSAREVLYTPEQWEQLRQAGAAGV